MNSSASTTAMFRQVFWLIAVCAVPHVSWGIAPPFISDEELARYPIIVVATWDKASFRSHANYSTNRDLGKVVTAFEAYTELNVRRVIKGAIQPGVKTLKLGYGVSWSTNGDRVTSGTSTELPGDVETVVESNLWFLKTSTSWDAKGTRNYLTLDNYRAIQPLVLEKYFASLGSGKPEKEVRALLASTNSTAVQRGLSYACDGIWPWPYDSDFTKFIRGSTPIAKKRAGVSTGGREPKAKDDFITLKVGESTEFAMNLYSRFLLAEPDERQLTLHYTDTGRAWGINAWVGTLTAEFGTGWNGQRKLETVEEKWPNGNLKTKGQTMNGEKYEEWQFFNEGGDRIRTINYSKGGSAECNPDHPSNKGAGKLR